MNQNKQPCIIVDIDGTIADCSHRRPYVTRENKKKDFEKFHDPVLVKQDKLVEPIREIIFALQSKYPIVWVSARPEALRSTTEQWLKKHGLYLYPHKLMMRPDGDLTPDVDFKRRTLHHLRAQNYEPWLALDDRDRVVEMWRSENITCLQVAEGKF